MNLTGIPGLDNLPCPHGLMCGGENSARMVDMRISYKKGNFVVRFVCSHCNNDMEVAIGTDQWRRYSEFTERLLPILKQYMLRIQKNYRMITNEKFTFEF